MILLDATFVNFEKNCPVRGDRLFLLSEYSIGRFPVEKHTRAIFDERGIDCVIDVGANEGQFARFIRRHIGFKGPILSFEPSAGPYARLAAAAADDALWSTFQLALGTRQDRMSLNIMKDSVFSSFQAPANTLFGEQIEIVETAETMVDRLDSIVERTGLSFGRAYLKTDTQGYDLEVLRGAERILSKVEAVQVELSFFPIYENVPLFDEVLGELREAGFVISGMYPVSLGSMQSIEMDGLLVRARPMEPDNLNDYGAVLSRRTES